MEFLVVFLLIIFVPLIFLVIGSSLIVKSIETFGEIKKENESYKIQRDFYKQNPGATQQDFLDWYIKNSR